MYLRLILMAMLYGILPLPRGGYAENGAANIVTIGHVDSMTGSEAAFGTNTNRGIRMAIDEANTAGGVKGRKIHLVSLDDQSKAEEAATAVTKAIVQSKVVAILGETTSSRSLAMAPIAQRHKIPMISPSATNPKVTEQGDHIFRVCFIDPFQGRVVATFAHQNLGIKRVAILRDVKSDYSIGLAEYFIREFKRRSGEIVIDQSYSSGDVDFKAQLTAIRAKKPEAIFLPGFYAEVGLIARQARALGIGQPLLGGDGWDSPSLVEIGGKALESSYFSNHYFPEAKSEQLRTFMARYKSLYGTLPDASAALGNDAALLLIDAMRRATSLEPKDIRDALAATKDLAGVTGNITIDSRRNAHKPAVIVRIENGKFVFHNSINPDKF